MDDNVRSLEVSPNNMAFNWVQDQLEEKIQSIREWIIGPGEKLLTSQTSKPYNFEEASEIRKAHEQFEFKCMKALENFAALCEYRKQNVPINEISELDYQVQSYIERLNKRTFFVVSCYSYFRLIEELWESIEELRKRSKEVDTYDGLSIKNAILELEIGLDKSDARLNSLSNELERLKVILTPTDPIYLGQLEASFNDVCKNASERIQEMRIRKLVLKKHAKLLECEENVYESIGWIEELMENVELLYQENCIGKNQLEATELLQKCEDIYKQAKTTYSYCTQLLETYGKLCEADGKKVPRNIGLGRSRLVRVWPRLERRLAEFRERTEAAESVYTSADSLLTRVQECLLEAARSPVAIDRACGSPTGNVTVVIPNEQNRMHLDKLMREFQSAKSLALAVTERLPRGLLPDDPPFAGQILNEVSRLIRLKMYTLWLKLREYEYAVVGQNLADLTTASELGFESTPRAVPMRSRSITQTTAMSSSHSPAVPLRHGRSVPGSRAPLTDPAMGESSLWRSRISTKVRSAPPTPPPIPPPSSTREMIAKQSIHNSQVTPQGVNGSNQSPVFTPIRPDSRATTELSNMRRNGQGESDRYMGPNEVSQRIRSAYNEFWIKLGKLKPRDGHVKSNSHREELRNAADQEMVYLEEAINSQLNTARDPNSAFLREITTKIRENANLLHEQWVQEWTGWSVGQSVITNGDDQMRLHELETDLGECQSRLCDLVNATCLTITQNAGAIAMEEKDPSGRFNSLADEARLMTAITVQDVERIAMIREETEGMSQTLPAQEEFINNLLSEVATLSEQERDRMQHLWDDYRKRLACFHRFSHYLDQGYKLLPRIEQFRMHRTACMDKLDGRPNELTPLQTQGHDLLNGINKLINPDKLSESATNMRHVMEADPVVDWLVRLLRESWHDMRDGVDELDMLASNIHPDSAMGHVDLNSLLPVSSPATSTRNTMRLNRPQNNNSGFSSVQRTPDSTPQMLTPGYTRTPTPPAKLDIPPPLPPRVHHSQLPMHDSIKETIIRPVSSQQTMKPSGLTSPNASAISAPVPDGLSWRITQPLSDVTCKADERAILRCQFVGPRDVVMMKAVWTFRPFVYTEGDTTVGTKRRLTGDGDSLLEQGFDVDYAQLMIKSVDISRAGVYTVRIVNVQTGIAMKSSAHFVVQPYFTKEPVDVSASIINAQTGAMAPVNFGVGYRGFSGIPLVQWTRDGEPLNPEIWSMEVNSEKASIFAAAAPSTEEGVYTCRVQDERTQMVLHCSAKLQANKRNTPKTQPSLKIGDSERRGTVNSGEPLAIRCPLPTSLDTDSCTIDWLLNHQAIYTYRPNRMGTTRSRDGSMRDASSEKNTFQYGQTVWRTYVSDGCCVLATNCVHRVDEGEYTCRIHVPGDVFESTGEVTVGERLEFTEILEAMFVQAGQPLELFCRLNRDLTQSDRGGDKAIEWDISWFLDDELLNPYKCIRLGLTLEQRGEALHVYVPNVTVEHAGMYRCQVTAGQTTVHTQCHVTVQELMPPKVLRCSRDPTGSIQTGENITIIVHYQAIPQPSCVWTRDDEPLAGANLNFEESVTPEYCQLKLYNLQPGHTGLYRVQLRNTVGADETGEHVVVEQIDRSHHGSSQMVDVTTNMETKIFSLPLEPTDNVMAPVQPDPFLIQPANITAKKGESVKFLCVLKPSKHPQSVVWSVGDKTLTSSSGYRMYNDYPREGIFQLEVQHLNVKHTGLYKASVIHLGNTNEQNLEASSTFRLIVDEAQTRGSSTSRQAPVLSDPTNQSPVVFVNVGDQLNLVANVSGSPIPICLWVKDMERVIQPTDSSVLLIQNNKTCQLVVHKAQPKDSGLWELICHNPYGSNMITRTVEVLPPGEPRDHPDQQQQQQQSTTDLTIIPERTNTRLNNSVDSTDLPNLSDSASPSAAFGLPPPRRELSRETLTPKSLPSPPGNLDEAGVAVVTTPMAMESVQLPNDSRVLEAYPPEFITVFTDVNCQLGETVRLTCRINGCPSPVIRWMINGRLTDGHLSGRFRIDNVGDQYNLEIRSAQVTDSGRYSITAENIIGVATCSALVFVCANKPSRSVSPLSEPGFYHYSPMLRENRPERKRERCHSGTQTPLNRRVAHIRSTSLSSLDAEHHGDGICQCCSQSQPFDCSHCHRPWDAQYLDHMGYKSPFQGRSRKGARARIRRTNSCGTPTKLSRPRSEGCLVHICPHCNTAMKPKSDFQDGSSYDEGDVIRSTRITERVCTYEPSHIFARPGRNRRPIPAYLEMEPSPRSARSFILRSSGSASPFSNHPHSHHHQQQQYQHHHHQHASPSHSQAGDREIPIQLLADAQPIEHRSVSRNQGVNDRITLIHDKPNTTTTTTTTTNITTGPPTPILRSRPTQLIAMQRPPPDTQFSTVESSDDDTGLN